MPGVKDTPKPQIGTSRQEGMADRAGRDEVEKQVGQPCTRRGGTVGLHARGSSADSELHLGPKMAE